MQKTEEFWEIGEEEAKKNYEEELQKEILIDKKLETIMIEENLSFLKEVNEGHISFEESETNEDKLLLAGELNYQEGKETGLVASSVYYFYMKNCGVCNTIIVMLIYAIVIMLTVFSDIWVSYWMKDKFSFEDKNTYIKIYGGILIITCLFLIIRAIYYSFIFSKGGYSMFKTMLRTLLKKPMSFFDTTSTGQILNRTSQDVSTADSSIPMNLNYLFSVLFSIIGTIVVAVVISPFLILSAIIMIIIIRNSLKQYLMVSVELERMVKLASSPMLSSVSEIIKGGTSIRAYDKLDYLKNLFIKRFNTFTNCNFHNKFAGSYIGVRVDYSAYLLIFSVLLVISLDKKFE